MIMDSHGLNNITYPADLDMADRFRAWLTVTAASLLAGKVAQSEKTVVSNTMRHPTNPEFLALLRNHPVISEKAAKGNPPIEILPSETEIRNLASHIQEKKAPAIPKRYKGWAEFYSRLLCSMRRRAFFSMSTAKQDLLGLAAGACRSGDQIWAVRGANVPLLFRPLEGQDEKGNCGDGVLNVAFMGECYVHGRMESPFARSSERDPTQKTCGIVCEISIRDRIWDYETM